MNVLTIMEAAEVLRLHPATIRKMVARGELDGVVRRGLGRVTLASVERLLSGSIHREAAASEAHTEDRLPLDPHTSTFGSRTKPMEPR